MKAIITGTTSGVGLSLLNELTTNGVDASGLNRDQIDLSIIESVMAYDMPVVDMFVNCAGTGIGGKINFLNHIETDIVTIMTTNLISPMILTRKALVANPNCKIVNITSTNNKRYYPNDLAYSLSKLGLSDFGKMLQIELPSCNYLEVQLGLTKTNFNNNRYKHNMDKFQDIYSSNSHLDSDSVAKRIMTATQDTSLKFIEIAP